MGEVSGDLLKEMMFEILYMERKNLRSGTKTDQRMSEEIQKVISEYAKLNK